MPTGDLARLALVREQNRLRARLISQLRRVHGLGPRPIIELVLELATRANAVELLERLAEHPGLDPNLLQAIGANDFPIGLIRFILGGRCPSVPLEDILKIVRNGVVRRREQGRRARVRDAQRHAANQATTNS